VPAPGLALIGPQTRSPAETRHVGHFRPSAAFIAQLAATALHVPQTRTRRRTSPRQAAALYAAGAIRERLRGLERKI
jgi:hypothetical protein